MGILSRMSTVVQAKMTRFLDKAEDPRETLDYSYEKQLQLLQNVKRGIVDVVTAKRRLELQAAKLEENIEKLGRQARQALAAGREDLARMALERKQSSLLQLQGLDSQIADLEKEQERLSTAQSRMAMKVEAFRTRKETIKAQYSAAEAQIKIGEATTGISEEMADVGLAIQRAEDKTEKLRARAMAIDELVQVGTLDDFSGTTDVVERELAQISAAQSVELELQNMRKQLGGTQPKRLKEGK